MVNENVQLRRNEKDEYLASFLAARISNKEVFPDPVGPRIAFNPGLMMPEHLSSMHFCVFFRFTRIGTEYET